MAPIIRHHPQTMSPDTTEPPASAKIDHAKALSYWSGVDPDVNGMLGGFPLISRLDTQGSKSFVAKLRRASKTTGKEFTRGVDCGAGSV
jgi:protein N-terminal methyltransferase